MSSFRLDTTTRDSLQMVVATTLSANPLAHKLLSKPKIWKGNRYRQPVKVTSNTNFVTVASGMTPAPTSMTDTTRNMEFEARKAMMNVALDLFEVDLNYSDTSVTDLVKFKVQEAGLDMGEAVGSLFYGNGVGNDFNGLGNIVDDGTIATTIGGLSRITFPTLNSTTLSAATLTIPKMVSTYNAVTDSGIAPNVIYTGKTVNGIYEQLSQTINQYLSLPQGQAKFNAGASELAFKGKIPVVIDSKCTAGVMFFLNMDYLDWVMVKPKMSEPINLMPDQFDGGVPDPDTMGLGFSWTGSIKSFNQYAINGFLTLHGNLIPKAPNRLAKITDIVG